MNSSGGICTCSMSKLLEHDMIELINDNDMNDRLKIL